MIYDDFNNGKTYKIYKDIKDVLNIGTTCTTLNFLKNQK
jgi:hypothetical protein